MNTSVFRFEFAAGTDPIEAEAILQLAIVAAEGLFGEARVRTDVSYHADAPRAVLLVDGGSPCGAAVVRIFTAFLTKEFGADGFAVRRIPCVSPKKRSSPRTPRGGRVMSATPQNPDDLRSSIACVLIREPADTYHARRAECLTSHRLAEFRSCPLLFQWKEMNLAPDRDSHAFLVGWAAHTLILEGRDRYEAEYAVGGPINEKTGKPYGSNTKAFAEWAEKRGKPVLADTDYDIGVMNGTIEYIRAVAKAGVTIEFEGSGTHTVDWAKAKHVELAYALTAHKAQGSEFPCAVVLCHKSHYFADRNWLYTAVTRAANTCILVGDDYGLRRAARHMNRRTLLSLWAGRDRKEVAA